MMFLMAQPSKEDGGMSIIQRAGEGRGGFLSGEGYHEPITPSIAVLQKSREVVWKPFLVSTELFDVGDCRGGCLEGIPCLYRVG